MEKVYQQGGPGLTYDLSRLRRDLVAGLTVAAVAVPQGMAYALVAGVPPEYGLYTAVVVTALSSVFGSSDHLINGPTNAISLVVFSAVAGLAPRAEGPEALQAVFLLAILVGLIQVVIAVLKLGDLTRYISESVILGFMVGAAVLVALGQLHTFFGLRPTGSSHLPFLNRLWLTFTAGGPLNRSAAGVGLGAVLVSVALRRLGKRLRVQVPDLLLALLAASVLVWALGWGAAGEGAARVEVLGAIPRTLPRPQLPEVRADWLRQLPVSAMTIAVLGLLEALAIAKSIAARTRQKLDFNRECLANGLANLGGGLFQCLPGSGSLTRSAINYQAGAATRVSGLISAAAVAVTLLLFAPLAAYVPRPALAGLLIVTAFRLVDRSRLRFCVRATRSDAVIALVTAASAVFFSVEFSILIGIFLSFLIFVPKAARLRVTELVVGPDRVIRERLPDDPRCGLLALFALEGEMFFGAAPELDEHFAEVTRRVEQGVKVVVLRLKRARNPDMVCLERLQHFLKDMNGRGVIVLLCGVRDDFARAMRNVRMHHCLPEDRVFLEELTAGSATLRAVRRAYELLGNERCAVCPRAQEPDDRVALHYMI